MARLTFDKARRIRRRAEYLQLQRTGKKLHSASLVFLYARRSAPLPMLTGPRLGVTVTRRLGSAVVRNRVRRLCKEVFRLTQHSLPADADIVIVPKDAAVRAGFFDLQQELHELCRRAFP